MKLCGTNPDYILSANQEAHSQGLHGNTPTYTDTCGNFILYFMDTTGVGFSHTTFGADRRSCACDVFTYISSVLDIPVGTHPEIVFQHSLANSGGLLGFASPYFPAAFNSGTPGFYQGYPFTHITTGVDPDTSLDDGEITINFGPGGTANFPDNCSLPLSYCKLDLQTVILHEATHMLGLISNIVEDTNANPISNHVVSIPNPAATVYTAWDSLFLFHWTGAAYQKLINNTTLAPLNSPGCLTSDKIWLADANPDIHPPSGLVPLDNQPVYSRPDAPNGAAGFAPGTSLSHLDNNYHFENNYHLDFRASASPGFSPDYLMVAAYFPGQVIREYSLQELRILETLGYDIDTGYYQYPILGNHLPFTTNQVVNTALTSTFYEYPNTVSPYNSYVVDNCDTFVLDLNASGAGFVDPDGDSISIYPGSLFNIRGCGNGGNNHNQISVNASNNVITFVPRQNFFGRAQFGFQLYDGKEPGGFVVVTVDVQKNPSCFSNGSEIVLNGGFEEGTEVRTVTDSTKVYTTLTYALNTNNSYIMNEPFADGLEYRYWGAHDVTIGSSYQNCEYGAAFTSFSPGSKNLPSATGGTRFVGTIFTQEFFNLTLTETVQPCATYKLKFEYNGDEGTGQPPISTPWNHLIIGFSSSLNSSDPLNYQLPVIQLDSLTWDSITVTFTVPNGTTPSDYLSVRANGGGYVLFDNFSLRRLTPYREIVPADTLICPGDTIQLLATGNQLYAWSPGATLSDSTIANPLAFPFSTTTYYVNISDTSGCTVIDSVTINIASPENILTADTTMCYGDSFQIQTSGGVSFAWSPGSHLTDSTIANPVWFNPSWQGASLSDVIIGVITDTVGCTWQDSIVIEKCCWFDDTDYYVSGDDSISNFGTSFSGDYFHIRDTLFIDQSVSFVNCTFRMDTLAKIIILSGNTMHCTDTWFEAGCDYMWDGLYVQSSATFDSTGGILGSINGLVSKGGGKYMVKGYVFQDNYRHLQVQEYNNPFGGHSGTVEDITTFKTPGDTLKLAPHIGDKTQYAIKVDSVTGINFGKAYTGNLIENAEVGIRINRSNVNVKGFTFDNLTYSTDSIGDTIPQTGVGIYITGGQTGLTSMCFVKVGGTAAGDSCMFEDLFQGIEASGQADVDINNCRFTNIGFEGVRFENITTANLGLNNKSLEVKGCSFVNNGTAIHGVVNTKTYFEIHDNDILSTNTRSVGINIEDNQLTSPGDTTIEVWENNIEVLGDGILMNAVSQVYAHNNIIQIDSSGQNDFGIKAQGCPKLILEENDVYADGQTDTTHVGIYVENCDTPFVKCNYVTKAGRSIVFSDVCSNTYFRYNTMSAGVDGLVLYMGGVIGKQGRNGDPSGNKWLDDSLGISSFARGEGVVDLSNGTQSTLFVRNNSSEDPDTNISLQPTFYPVITINYTSSTVGWPCPTSIGGGGGTQLLSGSGGSDLDLAVANDQFKGYGTYAQTQEYIAEQFLLHKLRNTQISLSANAAYPAFMNSKLGKNMDWIEQVDTAIQGGFIPLAKSFNNMIKPKSVVETNHKLVNSVYFNLLDSTFSSTQKWQLEDVALMCPFEGGLAVYQARSLMSLVDRFHTNYFNGNCNTPTKHKVPEVVTDQVIESTITIFPNPTTGTFTVQGELKDREGRIELFNLMGVKIWEQKLTTDETDVNPGSIASGVYLYRISINGELSKQGKLIITR